MIDYLPDEVFRGDDAGGDCVAEGVQLDSLVSLKVLLAEEDVEIWVLLDRHVDLVGVFRTDFGSCSACGLILTFVHLFVLSRLLLKCSWLVELGELWLSDLKVGSKELNETNCFTLFKYILSPQFSIFITSTTTIK